MTLAELIVAAAILSILAAAALPIARLQARRARERELKYDLVQMRGAIDEYKRAADRGAFMIKMDTFGYPPDLETLVSGIEIQGKKVKFLKAIPVDPMTGKAEWGLRSMEDDPTSTQWDGKNVFDVYSKSSAVGLSGTRYDEW